MKVAVLGAGIVGVTSAYQLAKAGHEVIVIDRLKGPALETSFANAGEISFGYCSPWAAPGIPLKAMKWLFMKHAPLILRPKLDTAMLSWLTRMLANCNSERYAINKSRMLRLADYSRVSLASLRAETGIEYDGRKRQTLSHSALPPGGFGAVYGRLSVGKGFVSFCSCWLVRPCIRP
ncbi:FAD-dependent oxidoreductase, partial [Mesorhizobium sp. M0276]|uniref:FAD-dependent oxidoreductase n=1 Tax=Mesorhizobium sp. M0276 TaxID=2956928 RepID=UPI0033396F07